MRFWLTLIVGTIVISSGLTWLVLHQGAQTLPGVVFVPPPAGDPPKLVFDQVEVISNTIVIDAGNSYVDKESKVEVAFRNEGKGKLEVRLIRTSCGCVHDVGVNDTKLSDGGKIEIPPGGSGKLFFKWAPKKEQVLEGPIRLTADFLVNDPQPQYLDGFRLELKTLVMPSQ
jgi:hypothetical protein